MDFPCPTCGQELEFVCNEAETVRHYHCLHCGTMVADYEEDGKQNIYVPKLAESIHMPEEKKTKAGDSVE